MLSESSYVFALYTYIGAALLMLLLLAVWLGRRWRAGWASLAVLLVAALMLTPAYPHAGVDTLAPAIIVAIFETLINGPDAAMHALRPLGAMLVVALILALFLRLTVFRRSRVPVDPTGEK